MPSLLNKSRPTTFCPGCGHEKVVSALDKAFGQLRWEGHEIVIVSDIGCSGLLDTFFNTHAFHGLHGRALTYAIGIKMSQPKLHVVVTMGDGGLSIGAAHFLSISRRNIDITLFVLNNFAFGMTGGQFSPTTPADHTTASGFLNHLEKPFDICQIAASSGAAYALRLSVYAKDLSQQLVSALQFKGFSVVDLHGICTGRVALRNRLTPQMIEESMAGMFSAPGVITENVRAEYVTQYWDMAHRQPSSPPILTVPKKFKPIIKERKESLILGTAGQRIATAGEILCLAAMHSGLYVACKTDYPITVLRGHSICHVTMSPLKIDFAGVTSPDLIIAISQEGIERGKTLIGGCLPSAQFIIAAGLSLPQVKGKINQIDFHAMGIKTQDWALAALVVLTVQAFYITPKMLFSALTLRFEAEILEAAISLVEKVRENAAFLTTS